jgi:predicted transposase YdaD
MHAHIERGRERERERERGREKGRGSREGMREGGSQIYQLLLNLLARTTTYPLPQPASPPP